MDNVTKNSFFPEKREFVLEYREEIPVVSSLFSFLSKFGIKTVDIEKRLIKLDLSFLPLKKQMEADDLYNKYMWGYCINVQNPLAYPSFMVYEDMMNLILLYVKDKLPVKQSKTQKNINFEKELKEIDENENKFLAQELDPDAKMIMMKQFREQRERLYNVSNPERVWLETHVAEEHVKDLFEFIWKPLDKKIEAKKNSLQNMMKKMGLEK